MSVPVVVKKWVSQLFLFYQNYKAAAQHCTVVVPELDLQLNSLQPNYPSVEKAIECCVIVCLPW